MGRIPRGTYTGEIYSDGYEEPVRLAASMEILDDGIEVDFTGTSGLSSRGINVPRPIAGRIPVSGSSASWHQRFRTIGHHCHRFG